MPNPIAKDSFPDIPPNFAPNEHPKIFPAHASKKTTMIRGKLKLAAKFIRSPINAKNNGAKIFIANWVMTSFVRSVRCLESPIAVPTMKAPKTA